MRIDIHTHAFHPKIAAKAVAHLNEAYDLHCEGDGTVEHLLACERAAGVDRCVVLCAATTPAQVIPANNYARELQRAHPEIIGFGTLHPAYARWEEELHNMERDGLRGIKLHPDFQGFRLDDPRLLPMFEAAQGRFILEIHIGSAQPAAQAPSCPHKLAAIARAFPGLTLIAAHFGGYLMWDMAIDALAGFDNVWFDTSSTSPFVTPHLLRRLLDAHPLERFLFGSDWPLYDPAEEQRRLQRVGGLSDNALERILTNAEQLPGLL